MASGAMRRAGRASLSKTYLGDVAHERFDDVQACEQVVVCGDRVDALRVEWLAMDALDHVIGIDRHARVEM